MRHTFSPSTGDCAVTTVTLRTGSLEPANSVQMWRYTVTLGKEEPKIVLTNKGLITDINALDMDLNQYKRVGSDKPPRFV